MTDDGQQPSLDDIFKSARRRRIHLRRNLKLFRRRTPSHKLRVENDADWQERGQRSAIRKSRHRSGAHMYDQRRIRR